MAHNILNDNAFYSHRIPAWHKLGLVDDQQHTAVEAGKLIGLPQVYERKVYYQGLGDLKVEMPSHKAIVGVVDKKPVPFAIVSANYTAITHQDFVSLIDRATGEHHIETMGVLGKGDTVFVTLDMGKIDVHGDEVANYLMVMNPLNGKAAITGKATSVRVVCRNTLDAALARQTSHEVSINHLSKDVHGTIEEWIRQLWASTVGMNALLKEAFDALVTLKVTPDDVATVINTVYPLKDAPITTDELKLEKWEAYNKAQTSNQDIVMDLFEGSQTRTAACNGTAWGMYNAVAEYEDHAKIKRSPRSVLFGSGAVRKHTAFKTLHAMVA